MTCMRESMKAETTLAAVEDLLQGYDIITFDVFDTLISRCVLSPVDVFAVVEAEAKQKYGLTREFARDRRMAEQTAYKKYGEAACFQQIYEILRDEYGYTDGQCHDLMALEFETELRLTIPREAVRGMVHRLLDAGKRILLCSDMYLNSNHIRKLLTRCGYPEDLELWVSCEKGATKHSGKLWDMLFAYLPPDKKIIHIGDNADADVLSLRQKGREALLIDSGLQRFQASALYPYLSEYMTGAIGNSLVLGYLVNRACFNSPFTDTALDGSVTSVWGGAAFSCFMDFLVKNRNDSQLLFVTREGFFLRPLYERYCTKLGVEPQCNALFYASRAAATAASVTSEQGLWDAMCRPNYQGTLGHFLNSRLNFDLSDDQILSEMKISLPEQKKEVFQILKPYFPQIFQNGSAQKEAYRQYIRSIRHNGRPLTIVDVGYNGTIQYGISNILGEKVAGLYLFLNDGALPRKKGFTCSSVANPRDGQHPIYDNLLFLEAVMQVPYGQLQKMETDNGKVCPIFNSDANFSKSIPDAQEAFSEFVEWIADWQKDVGESLQPNLPLAEAIWICLLRFGCLPRTLLEDFWLSDNYCGVPTWKYDVNGQKWVNAEASETPLVFTLLESGTKLGFKYRIKNTVKKWIPDLFYEWARRIWQRYIR